MIPFTQYLLPFGETRADSIDRPSDIEAMAQAVIANGGRFESEILRTGQVSFEVVRDTADGEIESLAAEVTENGPTVLDAVDRLVRAAHAKVAGDA